MPGGFFQNLPVLSAIPNPLNLFNGDDETPPHSPNPSTPSQSKPTAGSSKPTPILEGNGHGLDRKTPQARKASGATVMIAAEADNESDSPRSSRSGGISAVGAVGSAVSGRPRGLSVVSDMSGGTADSKGRRRRNRVETFVLVKPPPTAAKNPLNLQVQLVISEKKPRSRRPSDAASRAVGSSGDLSSAPSTPPRQSYEKLEDDPEKTPTVEGSMTTPTPASAAATGRPRSNSVSSGRSRSSSGASAGSAVSSTVTASGKRIVPLYNLAVHNVVQPTIVTDAGTDSRVAKFSKRQLDIAGVGILEPSEVWLPYAGQTAGSPRPSFDTARTGGRPVSMVSTMSSLTPATSRVEDPKRSSTDIGKPVRTETLPKEDGAKKFFSKIFRKRGSADPLVERRATTGAMLPPASNSSSLLAVETSNSLQVPSAPSSPQLPSVHFPSNDNVPALPQIGHPTFGLAPNVLTRFMSETTLDASGAIVGITSDTLPSPNKDETVSLHRSTRPIGYSWTVRKWAKKSSDGWAAHLVAAAAAGLDLVQGAMPSDGDDDVVFEWVKLRVSPNGPGANAVLKRHMAADQLEVRRKRAVTVTSSARPSPAGSRSSLALARKKPETIPLTETAGTPIATKSKIFRRASLSVRPREAPVPKTVVPATISGKTSRPASTTSGSGTGSPSSEETGSPSFEVVVDDGDAYDSDPEDSETPWQCSVWVKHTGQRQLIATLTPAPHHPKVIGVLRIPMDVRSICLTEVGSNAAPSNSLNVNAASQLGTSPTNDSLLTPGLSRVSTTTGTANVEQRIREEIALTEENIKDVVSVTAMWLVAREEFGGLGAKSRSKK